MAKVLVVDDSASVRSRVAKYVLGLGHEVEEAEDGEKAVAKFDEWSPDLAPARHHDADHGRHGGAAADPQT